MKYTVTTRLAGKKMTLQGDCIDAKLEIVKQTCDALNTNQPCRITLCEGRRRIGQVTLRRRKQ